MADIIVKLDQQDHRDIDLGNVIEVETKYTGVDTDNIDVSVDNKIKTISVSLKQNKFNNKAEFPEVGSDKQIYVDLSDRSLWIYDKTSATYLSVYKRSSEVLTFPSIKSLIDRMNALGNLEINKGASLYIIELNVPDFWVYDISDTAVPYTYTSDSAFVNKVKTDGYVQIGYYKVSLLETEKIDLTPINTKIDELQQEVVNIDGIVAENNAEIARISANLPTVTILGGV